ncbi:MAG: tetratricopeptide repeat protein [Pseudomonadota bacterium]
MRPNKKIGDGLILIILPFILLLLGPSSVLGEKIVIDSDDQLEFAHQTMERGDYDRAIGEFERFIYFFPRNEKVPEAQYFIGECYLKAKRYENARNALELVYKKYPRTVIAGKALFLMGESYYRQGVPKEADYYYQKVIQEYPDTELRNAAFYRIGWTRMEGSRWKEASEILKGVEPTSPLYESAVDLSEKSLQGENLEYKSPAAAGVMAGILPGLGHVYCNRYKDGLMAFLLNGSFIWAAVESFQENHDALGGILLFLELGWYSGNIYSAVNCAHKENRKRKEEFLKQLPDNLNLGLFTNGQGHLGLALKFDF